MLLKFISQRQVKCVVSIYVLFQLSPVESEIQTLAYFLRLDTVGFYGCRNLFMSSSMP